MDVTWVFLFQGFIACCFCVAQPRIYLQLLCCWTQLVQKIRVKSNPSRKLPDTYRQDNRAFQSLFAAVGQLLPYSIRAVLWPARVGLGAVLKRISGRFCIVETCILCNENDLDAIGSVSMSLSRLDEEKKNRFVCIGTFGKEPHSFGSCCNRLRATLVLSLLGSDVGLKKHVWFIDSWVTLNLTTDPQLRRCNLAKRRAPVRWNFALSSLPIVTKKGR